MSLLFKRTLSGHIRIYNTPIHNHVTELAAKEGIADFVLSPTQIDGEKLEWATKLASSVSTPSIATVAATLHVRTPLKIQDICESTGFSRKTAQVAIRELVGGGVALGNPEEGFRLRRPIKESDIELWAYELKLKDWKRGMYQALRYKAFAHSVAIVLPHEQARPVMSKLKHFRAYHVGVLTFDPATEAIEVLVRPGKSRPRSLDNYLYALSKFMRGLPWHPLYKGPPKSPRLPHQRRRK